MNVKLSIVVKQMSDIKCYEPYGFSHIIGPDEDNWYEKVFSPYSLQILCLKYIRVNNISLPWPTYMCDRIVRQSIYSC